MEFLLSTRTSPKNIKAFLIHVTFEKDYTVFDEVKKRVVTFATLSAEKLRNQHSMCSRLIVFVETNRFNRHEDFYSNSVQMKLSFPTSSSLEIVEFAVKGLKHTRRTSLQKSRRHFNRFCGRQCLPAFTILQFKSQT